MDTQSPFAYDFWQVCITGGGGWRGRGRQQDEFTELLGCLSKLSQQLSGTGGFKSQLPQWESGISQKRFL